MSHAEQRHMAVEEFVEWAAGQPGDTRYELYDGVPFKMMAPETFGHGDTKFAVTLAFRQAIAKGGLDGQAFVDSVGVRIDGENSRSPDVSVLCGPYDPNGHWLEDPIALVEIASPSSARMDAEMKLLDYFRVPSVRHYLVVYPRERKVVHHRRADEGDEIATRIVSEGRIDLSPPGSSVDMADLFEDFRPSG